MVRNKVINTELKIGHDLAEFSERLSEVKLKSFIRINLKAMDSKLRRQLKIPPANLASINKLLLDPNNRLVNDVLAVIAKHGTIEEINRKSEQARAGSPICKRGSKL